MKIYYFELDRALDYGLHCFVYSTVFPLVSSCYFGFWVFLSPSPLNRLGFDTSFVVVCSVLVGCMSLFKSVSWLKCLKQNIMYRILSPVSDTIVSLATSFYSTHWIMVLFGLLLPLKLLSCFFILNFSLSLRFLIVLLSWRLLLWWYLFDILRSRIVSYFRWFTCSSAAFREP